MEAVSARHVSGDLIGCLLTKLCVSLAGSVDEASEMTQMRQLGGVFDYDEESFLSFYKSIRRQLKPQEAEQGLVDGVLTPVKKVLFEWVATQQQRDKRPLFEPLNRFEVPLVTRWLVKVTVVVNTWIYCLLHGETERLNWEVFFDNPENLYISLRWLGDFRSWIWMAVFWGLCRLCFGFGKLILL